LQVSDLEQQLLWQQEVLDQHASEQQQLKVGSLGQQLAHSGPMP
jgi:hypothetical protein